MAYATLADVEAKWRPLPSAAEQARASALLEEAEALLASRRPGLAADVASGAVPAVLARKVVTDAVIRVLANPAGVTQQTLGPEAVAYAGIRALGVVAFTADELDSLTPCGGASAGGSAVGSARLALSPAVEHVLHPRHRSW